MKTFKKWLSTISLALLLSFSVTPVAMAASNAAGDVCDAIGASTSCNADSGNGGTSVNKAIKYAVQVFSIVVGVVSVIMVITGGFKYITANGDSGKINSAKNTIIYALVGLFITAIAQILVNFVLSNANQF